jgi:hypothetical protein
MFTGDTDPLGWGTGGVPQPEWTEQIAGNEPYDRRFLQSAGPFVLKPGSVNNITVGVVWARASSGDPFASVEVLRRADDKAQALFENCFKVLDGPQAPDLTIQELNNELIFSISNPSNSNNANEDYIEFDPFIVAEDSTADKYYRFQGYLIYQAKDASVSVSDIDNIAKARLVAQCDVKDGVGRIVNFEFDEDLQAAKPVEKVNGENMKKDKNEVIYPQNIKVSDDELFNHARKSEYANAHKHCHYSNVLMIDSVAKPLDYFNKAIELKHTTVFTTQHGIVLGFTEYYDLTRTLKKITKRIIEVIDSDEKVAELL